MCKVKPTSRPCSPSMRTRWPGVCTGCGAGAEGRAGGNGTGMLGRERGPCGAGAGRLGAACPSDALAASPRPPPPITAPDEMSSRPVSGHALSLPLLLLLPPPPSPPPPKPPGGEGSVPTRRRGFGGAYAGLDHGSAPLPYAPLPSPLPSPDPTPLPYPSPLPYPPLPSPLPAAAHALAPWTRASAPRPAAEADRNQSAPLEGGHGQLLEAAY